MENTRIILYLWMANVIQLHANQASFQARTVVSLDPGKRRERPRGAKRCHKYAVFRVKILFAVFSLAHLKHLNARHLPRNNCLFGVVVIFECSVVRSKHNSSWCYDTASQSHLNVMYIHIHIHMSYKDVVSSQIQLALSLTDNLREHPHTIWFCVRVGFSAISVHIYIYIYIYAYTCIYIFVGNRKKINGKMFFRPLFKLGEEEGCSYS